MATVAQGNAPSVAAGRLPGCFQTWKGGRWISVTNNKDKHGYRIDYTSWQWQVWPPGDAQQITGEPVLYNSSVSMGVPIKGPMFERDLPKKKKGLVCACGVV
jgi:hypothetical protein